MSGRRWRAGCCAAWSWTPWPRCGPGWDENTRWLLEARYILDYSDGELARELGVKPDSVRMALTRARRKARRLMESQHNEQNV